MTCACAVVMVIKSLEDLQVYQLSLQLADEISAIIERSCFSKDPELRKQMRECSARIPTNIGEGFGQRTDKYCAHFQSIARGSCNEMCAHLSVAKGRRYVTADELETLTRRYARVGKGLTQWIKHLEREDRQRRG